MGSIQIEIEYLKSAVRMSIFWLQTDMNQIFQMRYNKTLNDNYSKVIGCQSSRSKNYKLYTSELLLFGRPRFESRTLQTLRLCSFVALWSMRSYTTSFESPIILLLGFKSLWSLQHFKDNLCPHEQPLLYYIKRQKNEFFCKAL